MKPHNGQDRAGCIKLRTSYGDWFNSKLILFSSSAGSGRRRLATIPRATQSNRRLAGAAKDLEKHASLKESKIKEPEPILNEVAGHAFHNTSKLNFQKLKGDPDKAAQNLAHYIKSFSSRARQVFEYFEFEKEIAKLDESNRLFLVLSKFADIDLHPDAVPNHQM